MRGCGDEWPNQTLANNWSAVCGCICVYFSLSVSQSVSQSVHEVSQSVSVSFTQSFNQSLTQSINQSINHPLTQAFNKTVIACVLLLINGKTYIHWRQTRCPQQMVFVEGPRLHCPCMGLGHSCLLLLPWFGGHQAVVEGPLCSHPFVYFEYCNRKNDRINEMFTSITKYCVLQSCLATTQCPFNFGGRKNTRSEFQSLFHCINQ